MAGDQRRTGLSARSAAGPGAPAPARAASGRVPRPAVPASVRGASSVRSASSVGASSVRGASSPAPGSPASPLRSARVPVDLPGAATRPSPPAAPAPRPRPRPEPEARTTPSTVAVPDSRVVYVSVAEAARVSGASLSAVRGWARDGQVRSRTGEGPRGERVEVAVADVERLTADRAPAPARRPGRTRAPEPVTLSVPEDDEPDQVPPGKQLVPMQTVEAMERLSGELYLAGQRAARAEAVAELRDRRQADLQREVEDLRREAAGLREQNSELLRRVAVAEAQVALLQEQGTAAGGEQRWRLRRG